jgi:dipeptidyl aminopeptidase/acylaminoacyl peptidase
VLDNDLTSVIVTRQSPTEIPNSYHVNLATSAERKLTDNKDYLPDLTQARRERFQVTRNDGVKFWVTVTYPRYYTFGKLPAFFWFYPGEFVDQAAYDRSKRTFNKNDFAEISASNKAILTRRGYLLVEPDCPIIGPAERKNDAYIPQLRNNLAATIDELDRRGIVDRTRLGLGGHSYGAFSTVNAMVHTPFFKAGIAGDGNYNRLLTPFGFQSDQRMLWDARETYLSMSPILYAEQMSGALLMYHGMEDQNVGTDPINSERLFATLQALGKPAALYMYPYEDHGQITQETILDQWSRWVAWLDKYLAK